MCMDAMFSIMPGVLERLFCLITRYCNRTGTRRDDGIWPVHAAGLEFHNVEDVVRRKRSIFRLLHRIVASTLFHSEILTFSFASGCSSQWK